MLSYQHLYHAGSRADIHKHDILCRVIASLCTGGPISCIETHAGRGFYDLGAPEAAKTGEAEDGWIKLIDDESNLEKLSPEFVDAIRELNDGDLGPLYPGSPVLAAMIMRPTDKLYLAELHPAEYAALKENVGHDKRLQLQKRDGIEFAETFPFDPPALILIDPSYEIKTEYDSIPDNVATLHKKFPDTAILVWVPMLKAGRHEAMVAKMQKLVPETKIVSVTWAEPGAVRGMFGTIMMGINAGPSFESGDNSVIQNL